MFTLRRRTTVALAALLGVGALVLVPVAGAAQGPSTVRQAAPAALPIPIPMPMSVGLTEDQAVRLSVVNLGVTELTVKMTLHGVDGVVGAKTVTLAPGATDQYTVGGASRALSFDRRGRAQVWGEFTPTGSGAMAGTIEVYDQATGTTQVVASADLPGPMPEPAVAGPLGLRDGQLGRVSVVNTGDTTKTVTVTFWQTDRLALQRLTLDPGQIGWVDFNPTARGVAYDRSGRAQITARVACRGLDCLIVSGYEGFAITNGRTSSDTGEITPIQLP